MNVIAQNVRRDIEGELQQIERVYGVAVLYACESGSRAWGFASPDSDYDVRFLYVRPRDWYLSVNLESRRDVIERPISDLLDISGWDLRKALSLFRKSNPPLHEWLASPIVYRRQGRVAARLQQLAVEAYNPVSAHYHYLSMAHTNYRAMSGERVRRKKYLYVLRSLLAVQWIEQARGVVPMEFATLVEQLVPESPLQRTIAELLAEKRVGGEVDRGPRLPVLDDFIDREFLRHGRTTKVDSRPKLDVDRLNELFRETLAADAPRAAVTSRAAV